MDCLILIKSAKVADMAKLQYNKFQNIVWGNHHSEFVAFDFMKDRLDVFLGKICGIFVNLYSFCLTDRVMLSVVFLSIKSLLIST